MPAALTSGVLLGSGQSHCPRPDVPCVNGMRTRTLARHLTGEPRMECGQGRAGTRARPAHDWRLARERSHPRASRDRVLAERWLPRPDGGAAIGAGRGAAADTMCGQCRDRDLDVDGRRPFLALSAPAGLRLKAPEEAAHRGGSRSAGRVRAHGRAGTHRHYGRDASINFVDKAHVRADAELTRLWVPKGEPALVASTSPRRTEKVGYYSAICLEIGRVDVMRLDSTSRAATSVAFLQQLRATYSEPLIVIWDNAPAHCGEELRADLARFFDGLPAAPTRPSGAVVPDCSPTSRC